MKRSLAFLSTVLFFIFSFVANAQAQDDQYYDPSKDAGVKNNQQQNDNQSTGQTNTTQQPVDKTDGYSTPADKYDPRNDYNSTSYNSSAYATDAGYYDDDYETYFYSNRLNRYYRPNYGISYYSYCYTPSYYSSWGPSYVVSYNPWYQDPWWRWNRRHHVAVVVYDPFWDWNFGWNSYAYYNSWSNPYWGYNSCNYYGGYSSWGYGGWGHHNGGFCGGYYNGYGYNNGYYNGYNNGYWNGYNDGWNSAYGYGGGYYYPHHRETSPTSNQPKPVMGNAPNPTTPPVDRPHAHGDIMHTDIPKEGITKPFTPNTQPNTPGGIKIDATTDKPYVNQNGATINNTTKPSVNIKPSEGNIGINNSTPNRWDGKDEKVNTFGGGNVPPSQNNSSSGADINGKYNDPKISTKPSVQQNNNNEPEGWHTAPPDRWSNKPPVQQQQPNQNDWNRNEQPRNNYSQPQRNDAPQYTPQPRNENNNWNRVEPRNEQPRNNFEQRNIEKPNMNMQPQQPRMNFQPQQQPRQENFNRSEPRSMQQQRSFSPAPQGGGGGGFKRH